MLNYKHGKVASTPKQYNPFCRRNPCENIRPTLLQVANSTTLFFSMFMITFICIRGMAAVSLAG